MKKLRLSQLFIIIGSLLLAANTHAQGMTECPTTKPDEFILHIPADSKLKNCIIKAPIVSIDGTEDTPTTIEKSVIKTTTLIILSSNNVSLKSSAVTLEKGMLITTGPVPEGGFSGSTFKGKLTELSKEQLDNAGVAIHEFECYEYKYDDNCIN